MSTKQLDTNRITLNLLPMCSLWWVLNGFSSKTSANNVQAISLLCTPRCLEFVTSYLAYKHVPCIVQRRPFAGIVTWSLLGKVVDSILSAFKKIVARSLPHFADQLELLQLIYHSLVHWVSLIFVEKSLCLCFSALDNFILN